MRALLVMLVGFSTVTMAETVPEAISSEISIIETGAPLVIENVVPSEVETKGTPTTALTLTARSTSEPVDSFTVSIQVIGSEERTRASYSYARLLEDTNAVRFTVLLTDWSFMKGDRIRVTVTRAHAGNRTWADGVWAEDPEMELPVAAACPPDFCRVMAEQCNVACNRSTQVHGAGCVLKFTCRMGPKYCESACICRQNVFCGGP